MRAIAARDTVRVVALTGPPAAYLVRASSERPPRVGDVGTVIDVAGRLGGVGHHYTVALRHPDGRPVWLAVFAAHELERVP